MNCRKIRPNLAAYLDKEVPKPLEKVIEAHAHGCPECSRELAELREISRLLRKHKKLEPPETLRAGVLTRARGRMLDDIVWDAREMSPDFADFDEAAELAAIARGAAVPRPTGIAILFRQMLGSRSLRAAAVLAVLAGAVWLATNFRPVSTAASFKTAGNIDSPQGFLAEARQAARDLTTREINAMLRPGAKPNPKVQIISEIVSAVLGGSAEARADANFFIGQLGDVLAAAEETEIRFFAGFDFAFFGVLAARENRPFSAEDYFRRNDFHQARSLLQNKIGNQSGIGLLMSLFSMAEAEYRLERINEAAEILKKTETVTPQPDWAVRKRERFVRRLADARELRREFAAAAGQMDNARLIALAVKQLESEDYPAATVTLRNALEKSPGRSREDTINVEYAAAWAGKFVRPLEDSRADFVTVRKNAARLGLQALAEFQIAELYRREDDYPNAAEHYRHSAKTFEGFREGETIGPFVLFRLCHMLLGARELSDGKKRAEDVFRELTREHPVHPVTEYVGKMLARRE